MATSTGRRRRNCSWPPRTKTVPSWFASARATATNTPSPVSRTELSSYCETLRKPVAGRQQLFSQSFLSFHHLLFPPLPSPIPPPPARKSPHSAKKILSQLTWRLQPVVVVCTVSLRLHPPLCSSSCSSSPFSPVCSPPPSQHLHFKVFQVLGEHGGGVEGLR